MTRNDIAIALERRLQKENDQPVAFPSYDNALDRLASEKLTFYLGIDATGPHVHIGHTIPLLLLKSLASFGHEIIVLLGDFTSRVGDPTDKMATRTALTEKDVEKNMSTYLSQIEKILPKKSFHVRHNSSWLRKMSLEKILELSGHVTVQQMMARDMFQKRKEEEKPIFISEFMYPLMQGYDSVAMDVDGEVGGNDQTFNMLMGRDLLKIYADKEKVVLPTRLLVDAASGKKVSKTEGGFIALDDEPAMIFEKVSRTIPNEMIRTVFELCTELPMDNIAERQRKAEASGDWRAFNLDLASELIRMYHGEKNADHARVQYEKASKGEVADEEAVSVGSDASNQSMTTVVSGALNTSKSDATRLIKQKAVTKNGELVEDALGPSGVQEGDVLRVGSHRPFRITLKDK